MRDDDLALIELLAGQIGEIANGICKVEGDSLVYRRSLRSV
jgi:hypothetical protein